MILLLISAILFVLKYFGIITWANWIIALPTYIIAGLSTWLYVKAEFNYFKNLKSQKKEAAQSTEE